MTENPPLTGQQRAVLQAIYDYFRGHGTWPTFITIDRPIRRARGWDTAAIVQSLPESVIVQPRHGNLRPVANDELRLRLRGFLAVQGSSDDTERFVRLLRWLAEREMEYEPPVENDDEMPQVTSEEVAAHLGLDDADDLVLRRLYAMLQLDHWGLGGSGSGENGWYVKLGPDIWRFRDVQSAEGCVAAREAWLAEGRLPAPKPDEAVQPSYYQVRISVKEQQRSRNRYWLDLSDEALESQILAPYFEGRAIVDDGVITRIGDITKIQIIRTEQPSGKLPRRSFSAEGFVYVGNDTWRSVVSNGNDVTNELITEAPGRSPTPATELVQPPPPPPQVPNPYVSSTIVEAIRAKARQGKFEVTKLLGLIDELNDNYARSNTYASHALLRAILDHVPPILGGSDFGAIANNYSWGRTDKRYMRKLADFRDQADDALHRQISSKADLLGFDDMPASVCVGRLLQECAEHL